MGGELVRPGSWWYFVAVVLLVIAGFLCFLAITAPVRGQAISPR